MSNRAKIVAIPTTTTTTTMTTYLPTSIAGCRLWLDGADAATITQSGGTVSQWNDKSGNGYNFTQGTTAYQPTFVSSGTNGLSLLRFNGTDQYLGGGTTLNIGTSDIAIFAVCKYASDASIGSSYIFAKSLYGGAAARILFGVQSMGIGDGTGGNIWWQGSSYESSYASYHSVEFVTTRASGTNTFYANGSQFHQISPGVDTSTNWTSGYNMIVGGYNNPSGGINPPQPGLYMKGDICEILIYAATITTMQRQTIEAYLAQKWGLTSSLPAGHTGLTSFIHGTTTVTIAVPKQKIRTIPRAGAFTNFLPTSITGCALWFDAADATTFTLNGSTVASWRDKSGNGYSVGQATTSNQPTYATNILNGLPGIQLSLSTYLYQVGSSIPIFASASAITVFMVAKNGSTYSSAAWSIINTMWFTGTGGATSRYHFSFALGSTPGVTIYPNQGAVVPLGSNALIGFTLAASGVSVNVNGSLTTFGGSTPTSASDSTWFMFGDARNIHTTDVNIYEFIGFTTTLTTTQRQTIESYLTQKWGLTASLPVGHPGLTTTVYGTTSAPTVRQKIRSIQAATVIPIFPYSITSGLLAFFSFNNTLADSQNTITLAATGSVSYVTGRTTNQAIYLANEANSAASTFAANYLTSSYNVTVPFSVSVWFKPTNTNQGSLLSTYNSTAITSYSVNLYISGGSMSAAYNNIQNVGASVGVSVGTWYHAVITVNASNGLTLFVNNSQVGSTITQTPSINGLMIGSIKDGGASYAFSGYLDDYRIYNRVLTGAEIGQIYAGTG